MTKLNYSVHRKGLFNNLCNVHVLAVSSSRYDARTGRVDDPVWPYSKFVAKANYVLSLSISDREILEVINKIRSPYTVSLALRPNKNPYEA